MRQEGITTKFNVQKHNNGAGIECTRPVTVHLLGHVSRVYVHDGESAECDAGQRIQMASDQLDHVTQLIED